MGRWVIVEAARLGAAWGAGRDSEPVICVNLSARQFAQPDLVKDVAAALESSGITPDAFCLEITESVVMEQTHATIATLGELKKLGLHLAIDDFGTGYSSLGYLQRFRLDYLKVDRSFVEGLGHDREQTAIVDAIVKMAQALGLRVIAEGVETEAQVETLRALGCDMVQGFLFARPQPPEEAATHLDETVYASAAP
jgi:EAL domain-containing protein (putative c-di-GMP-specific phosphodiesterase class I)